jgi:hypothetical protein
LLARPESPQAAIPGPTTASLSVRAGDDSDWLRFVEAHEDATLFHHPAWSRVLADSYAHRPVSLVQTDADGQITAGLPAMEIRRGLARPALVSLPFTDHCQPLARSPADLAILTTNLAGWRQSQHVPSISIHGALPAAPGVHLVIRGVRHILPLRPSSGSVLDGIRGGPVHRAIRKAQREGVDARLSRRTCCSFTASTFRPAGGWASRFSPAASFTPCGSWSWRAGWASWSSPPGPDSRLPPPCSWRGTGT